jgi:uncharacterized RDD family membrane protein YckC
MTEIKQIKNLAPLSKRALAYLIDIIIPVIFILIVAYMNNPNIKQWKMHDISFYFQCVIFLYSLVHGFIIANSSYTLGCYITKIRVVKMKDHLKLSVVSAIFRSFISFQCMPIMLVSLFLSPFKERKQTGWDMLSGAIVINEVPKQ